MKRAAFPGSARESIDEVRFEEGNSVSQLTLSQDITSALKYTHIMFLRLAVTECDLPGLESVPRIDVLIDIVSCLETLAIRWDKN